MDNRRLATWDIWVARIGSVFGWILIALFLLAGLVSFLMDPPYIVIGIVLLVIAALMIVLLFSFRKTRNRVKGFRYYANALVHDKSITNLSANVGEPKEEITKKLQQMCRRGYFDGYVDIKGDRLVLTEGGGAYAAKCPGCGAKTTIYKTGDCCRYCGIPLVVREEDKA